MNDETAYFRAMMGEMVDESGSCSIWLWLRRLNRRGGYGPPVCKTLQGRGHSVNQDAAMVVTSPVRLMVADGISSGCCSEVASHLAVSFLGNTGSLSDSAMIQSALFIDRFLLWMHKRYDLPPGGTTLVLAEVRSRGRVSQLNIGDSRGWLLSPSFFGGYRCRQVTVDQTWGERKKSEQLEDPDSYPDNVMFHALGYGLDEKEVQVTSVTIPPGGYLLLTTDGAFKKLGDDASYRFAEMAESVDTTQELVDAVVQRALDLGETDDISVAVYGRSSDLLGARGLFWFALCCAIAFALCMR